VTNDSLKSTQDIIDVVKFLVAKESGPAPAAAPAPAKKP
jgi:hypothetical protein